jgi:ATP phosphoribosyltransferase regulatory subunit
VLQGGRYNGVGAAFGRSRPATGLSGDLKLLADLMPAAENVPEGVLAPGEGPEDLQRAVQSLRAQGIRVVQALDGEGDLQRQARELNCAQVLVHDSEQGWRAMPVTDDADD